MKQSFIPFILGALFLYSCISKNKGEVPVTQQLENKVDDRTVDFPIYDFEGLEPLLNFKDDKTYIVNFWATWCKPCLEELPYFEKTYAEQKENNVEMFLVSLDLPSMWEKRLVPYVKEKQLKGKVVILDDADTRGWIKKISKDWDGGIPATIIYNKNKRTFYPHGFTYNELNTELDKFNSE